MQSYTTEVIKTKTRIYTYRYFGKNLIWSSWRKK